MKKAGSIDEYINAFPKETQKHLKQIRSAIRKTIPGAEETISYAIPCFKLQGKYVIYFAGYKNHIGMYPVPTDKIFEKEFAPYKTSGKGAIQFPLDKPIPVELVKKIVRYRVDKSLERAERQKGRKAERKNV